MSVNPVLSDPTVQQILAASGRDMFSGAAGSLAGLASAGIGGQFLASISTPLAGLSSGGILSDILQGGSLLSSSIPSSPLSSSLASLLLAPEAELAAEGEPAPREPQAQAAPAAAAPSAPQAAPAPSAQQPPRQANARQGLVETRQSIEQLRNIALTGSDRDRARDAIEKVNEALDELEDVNPNVLNNISVAMNNVSNSTDIRARLENTRSALLEAKRSNANLDDDSKKGISEAIEKIDKAIDRMANVNANAQLNNTPAAPAPQPQQAPANNPPAPSAEEAPPRRTRAAGNDLFSQLFGIIGGGQADLTSALGLNLGNGDPLTDVNTFGPLGEVVTDMKINESLIASVLPSVLGVDTGSSASILGGGISGLNLSGLGLNSLGITRGSNDIFSNIFLNSGVGSSGGILDSLGINQLMSDITTGRLPGRRTAGIGSLGSDLRRQNLANAGVNL